jgi:glutathionylspermidine synthase
VQRKSITPRPDYAAKLEAQGLSFHAADSYWREDACYRFTLPEIEQVEAASAELHQMCLAAARQVVQTGRLAQLQIPEQYWSAIAASLERQDFSIYGRLDLVYDGHSPPKLLEYNADTPTSLLESAVCQWYWLKDQFPDSDQFNSIHERLIDRWRELPETGPIHMASLAGHEEDWACLTYLMDTLAQADRQAIQLTIEDVGWEASANSFVDLNGAPIRTLFKLYPWEWMMREAFGPNVLIASTRFIEPLWKSVLSCKALLPILWEMYPGHANLLPAYFEPGPLTAYAKKPLYSREGANIELRFADGLIEKTVGPYGEDDCIYQGLQPLPNFDGYYPVIGSWVINGEAAGMGIREDRSRITTNTSHFVPHYFS